MLTWKREGKTTRAFRYDLNQIPYNYTVEVTNRFKGFDLLDRMPEELLMDVCDTVQCHKPLSIVLQTLCLSDRIP